LVTSGQSYDEKWTGMRCWMITASRAKRVDGLTADTTISSYLSDELWKVEPGDVSPVRSAGYGTKNEPVALVCYILQKRWKHPNSTIAETVLWASLEYPQLSCSPDGKVDDPVRPRRLLEVKCPYTLRDHDPNSFETADKRSVVPTMLSQRLFREFVLKKIAVIITKFRCT